MIYERSLNDNLQFVSIVLKMNPFAFYRREVISPRIELLNVSKSFLFLSPFPFHFPSIFYCLESFCRHSKSSGVLKLWAEIPSYYHLMSILLFCERFPWQTIFAISCEKSGVPSVHIQVIKSKQQFLRFFGWKTWKRENAEDASIKKCQLLIYDIFLKAPFWNEFSFFRNI